MGQIKFYWNIDSFVRLLTHSFTCYLLSLTAIASSECGWILPGPMKARYFEGLQVEGEVRRESTEISKKGKTFRNHWGQAQCPSCIFQTISWSQL